MGQALDMLATTFPNQPSLADLSAHVGLSEYYFQRMFIRWVGVSPKKFLQHLTLAEAKRRLRESASVLDAAYDAGLSGPGRLHDLFVTFEAMTPGEYKARGQGLTIRYGYHETPFGECLLMATERGVCGLGFIAGDAREAAYAKLSRGWERAQFVQDDVAVADIVPRMFAKPGQPTSGDLPPIRLLLRGSRFQLKVWQALLEIPQGGLTTYQDIAHRIGLPAASRAVGNANGANPISWLIPCHRVIRKSGELGGYGWGLGRKVAMIGWEAARAEASAQSS
ncbi:MAG: bifunctional helix-turn-helix domain-containing protein/methylated-DNA--[protein]-cysteine S-methyltransferase [Alphaproteobacteria bacterium]|nr:bifunctional helix-turn-helix domain-containing protein/methylated-DNA--[protein]-cysteine S-methyltransferase [Alphaproteobacteria bacterium]